MNANRCFSLAAAAIAILLATGCAEVNVKKIATPTQYLKWTDKMQEESDSVKGVRFYLPRPFISVFESFPVHSDVYLARGQVTPDGRYITIDKLVEVKPGGGGAVIYSDDPIKIAPRNIYRPDAATARALAEAAGKAAARAKPESASEPPPAEAPPSSAPKTGTSTYKVTNDNAALAFQPLRGNFDVVYMPDFEEQYAVVSKPRLGNAAATVNLGQGWSLQGMDATTDNSAIVGRVFALIDTATKLGTEAAKTALGLPPGTTLVPKPESATESLDAKSAVPGTAISLKVTVVHYAAKGLYPVLKPRELQQRRIDADASYQITADLGAAAVTSQPIQTSWGRFTVPVYPYQHVSFNTFRFMAIEGMHPDDPFAHLIDKTGTTGSPGDRRTEDVAKVLSGLAQSGADADKRATIDPSIINNVQNDLMAKINQAFEQSSNESVKSARAQNVAINERGDKVMDLVVTLQAKPSDAAGKPIVESIRATAKKLFADASQLSGYSVGEIALKP